MFGQATLAVCVFFGFGGGLVLHRIWSTDYVYINSQRCAETFFGTPKQLDGNLYGLSLFVSTDHLTSHEAVGKLADTNVTKNVFVVGCTNRLQWLTTTQFLYSDAVLAFSSLCKMDTTFHELNMYYFHNKSPCIAATSANCIKLIGNEFVCSV